MTHLVILILLFITSTVNCTTPNLNDIDFKTEFSPNSTYTTRSVSLVSKFYLYYVKMPWRDALDWCTRRGQKLLTITSSEMDESVANALAELGAFSVWTSGNDLEVRHVFKWWTTNSYIRYSNWRNGFPDNLNYNGCVSVSNLGACGVAGKYGWDKQDCMSLLYPMCYL